MESPTPYAPVIEGFGKSFGWRKDGDDWTSMEQLPRDLKQKFVPFFNFKNKWLLNLNVVPLRPGGHFSPADTEAIEVDIVIGTQYFRHPNEVNKFHYKLPLFFWFLPIEMQFIASFSQMSMALKASFKIYALYFASSAVKLLSAFTSK
jgi:hypothetical protein